MAEQQLCIVQYEIEGVENEPDKMGNGVSGCTEKWVYKKIIIFNSVSVKSYLKYRALTLQKRDKATGEIQRKRMTEYLENSKGKTENLSVQPTLYLCVLKRNGCRGRC